MSTTELMEMIQKLPEDKKKAVEDMVFSLASEYGLKISEIDQDNVFIKPKMKFGELKGFLTYIADDFDEPLDDFKEYI